MMSGGKAHVRRLAFMIQARLWRGLSDGNGASRSACSEGFGFRLTAGLPYGNGLRAPPCTRKEHRPLTRIGAKLAFCLFLPVSVLGRVGGLRPVPYCRLLAKERKPFRLACCRFGCAYRRVPCGNSLRAPPCTRKGQRPLTWVGAKLVFCLLWGRIAPAGDCPAEIGRENGRKPLKNVDLTGANIV